MVLKSAVVRSLDSTILENYWLASNLLFLGQVIKLVLVSQLQNSMDGRCYLDPFQSGYGLETAMVTRRQGRVNVFLLVLLDLSAIV